MNIKTFPPTLHVFTGVARLGVSAAGATAKHVWMALVFVSLLQSSSFSSVRTVNEYPVPLQCIRWDFLLGDKIIIPLGPFHMN